MVYEEIKNSKGFKKNRADSVSKAINTSIKHVTPSAQQLNPKIKTD